MDHLFGITMFFALNTFNSSHEGCSSITVGKLPFEQHHRLRKGDSHVFRLPGGKTLAIWCESVRVSAITESFKLHMTYGEKPFQPIKTHARSCIGGEGIFKVIDSSSYIKTGSVTTWSRKDDCLQLLYVEKFKITIHQRYLDDTVLSTSVRVVLATGEELDSVLEGPALRNRFLLLLQSENAKNRLRAINRLMDYVEYEKIGTGILRKGLHPIGHEIRDAIEPLLRDTDSEVRVGAEAAFQRLGGVVR